MQLGWVVDAILLPFFGKWPGAKLRGKLVGDAALTKISPESDAAVPGTAFQGIAVPPTATSSIRADPASILVFVWYVVRRGLFSNPLPFSSLARSASIFLTDASRFTPFAVCTVGDRQNVVNN